MEDLTNKDIDLLDISNEEQFNKNFKAMYYCMNAKPDSTTRVFQKEVIVGIDDIFELNELITDKFKNHYKDSGFIINVTVSFSDRKSLAFSSWKEFKEHKWIESHSINSITLSWDFNLKLPGYALPQRHTIMVKISDGMRPEEMLSIIFSGNIEDLDETNINKDFCPIVARVDFINPLIGDELLNIVANWAKGLRRLESTKSRIILKLQKHKRKVAYGVNYIILLISILLGVLFLENVINSYKIKYIGQINKQQLSRIINIIAIILVICIVISKVFALLANSIFNQLKEYGETHIFDITKGDKNKQADIIQEDNNTRNSILIKLMTSFILDLVCGIISGYLLK